MKHRFRWPIALWGCVAGLLFVMGKEAGYVFLGRNFHEILAGRVYRCSQQSGQALEDLARAHRIRTVVNLRGCAAPLPWYLDECRATHRLNVSQEDVCLSANRLPAVPEIRRLIEVLDRTDYPILLHCRRGADRTGLAAAVVLLLQNDMELEQARRQLGLRYGHLRLGRTTYLDQFFDLYAEWLAQRGSAHSPAAFRYWIAHDYCPGACRCVVEPLEVPASVAGGQPALARVRVRNTSLRTWKLRSGTNTGIHVGYILIDAQDQWVTEGRSGLFDAEVAGGESIELSVVLPPFKQPGRYRLLIDMVEEQQCWFFQTGSEPLERELEVRE